MTGAVSLTSNDGHVDLSDVGGAVTVSTSDGGVDVTGARGRLRVSTNDGRVELTDLSSADVSVRTSDGAVRAAFTVPPAMARMEPRDGWVDVTVPPDGTAYDLVVDTASGSRQVSVPTAPSSSRRIEVHTADGSVRIAEAP